MPPPPTFADELSLGELQDMLHKSVEIKEGYFNSDKSVEVKEKKLVGDLNPESKEDDLIEVQCKSCNKKLSYCMECSDLDKNVGKCSWCEQITEYCFCDTHIENRDKFTPQKISFEEVITYLFLLS